jgi:hypothetical protein
MIKIVVGCLILASKFLTRKNVKIIDVLNALNVIGEISREDIIDVELIIL